MNGIKIGWIFFILLVALPKAAFCLQMTESGYFGGEGEANGLFKYPQGMAFDAEKRQIHVVDNGNKRIQVFSADTLGFVRSYGSTNIFYPIDVALGDGGLSFISNYGEDIVVVDETGQDVKVMSMLPTGDRPWPTGIFFEKVSKLLFVSGAPTENGRVSIWRDGVLETYWSAKSPYDVWVSRNALVYVAAWDSIDVYDLDGMLKYRIPVGNGAVGVTGDDRGVIYVTYYYDAKIEAFLSDGSGRKVGSYVFPSNNAPPQPYSGHHYGLVYDPNGFLFVTNRLDHSVTRLRVLYSDPGLLSATLPSARSVTVGTAATAFGTIINATGEAINGCYLALPSSPLIPATFNYQTTNASNQLVGTANTPVNIPAGGSQNFVFGITPSAAFAATDIPIVFDCANTLPAPSQTGLNTFLLSASSTPVPDMVAIGATPSGDGVLRIPGSNGVHAFGTAAVNIGGAGDITATVDTGGVPLPLTLTLCQTKPDTGDCLSPPASSTTSTLATNASATYAVFAQASGAIPFDPAGKRIFLRLTSGGTVRGATSVAVTTQ